MSQSVISGWTRLRKGEVLGYISLDQARVLAMRTAREIQGAYGRRFRNSPMAFWAVNSNFSLCLSWSSAMGGVDAA